MLKAVLTAEELGKLPADQKSNYVERNGQYVLALELPEGWGLEDVRGLKTALAAEREAKASLERRVSKFGDLDPEVARDALSKVEKMKTWTPEEKVAEQMKAREDALTAKHRGELTQLQEALQGRDREVSKLLIDSEAMRLLDGKASVELLLPIIQGATKVVRDADGKSSVVVLDHNGNPRISGAPGSTANMTLAELVETMRNDKRYAPAFYGSPASGSGATGGATGNAPAAGVRTVKRGDAAAKAANLDGIASGKVVVVD